MYFYLPTPCSQLFYDGYQNLAVQLSNLVKAHPACPPSDKLLRFVAIAMETEEGKKIMA